MTPVEEDRRNRLAQFAWDVKHNRRTDSYQIVRGFARAGVLAVGAGAIVLVVGGVFTLLGLLA